MKLWSNQRLGALPRTVRDHNNGMYFTVDGVIGLLRMVRDDYEKYIAPLQEDSVWLREVMNPAFDLLREENKSLKKRIAELEVEIEAVDCPGCGTQ